MQIKKKELDLAVLLYTGKEPVNTMRVICVKSDSDSISTPKH